MLRKKGLAHRIKDDPMVSSRSISLWLDEYEDIFSDFDPRPFSERNISDDFLREVKKVSRENEMPVSELRLLIPQKKRIAQIEEIIVKRLHTHFRSSHMYQHKEYYREIKVGIQLLVVGIVLTLGAGYVSAAKEQSFLLRLLFVLSEPAGWFFIWVGFEKLFLSPKKDMQDLNFYSKIHKSKIDFAPIHEENHLHQ